MNIKSIANNVTPIESNDQKVDRTSVKAENSSKDRDSNGRREDQHDQDLTPLTEEEMEKALEYLETVPHLKDHGFIVSVKIINNNRFIMIEDASGNVVRRIPDYEMRSLVTEKEKPTGHLLNKAL